MENGQIYHDLNDANCAIALWLTGNVWVLLSGPAPGQAMTIIPGPNDELFYTKVELQSRLEREGWQHTEASLTVQAATLTIAVGEMWLSCSNCARGSHAPVRNVPIRPPAIGDAAG